MRTPSFSADKRFREKEKGLIVEDRAGMAAPGRSRDQGVERV